MPADLIADRKWNWPEEWACAIEVTRGWRIEAVSYSGRMTEPRGAIGFEALTPWGGKIKYEAEDYGVLCADFPEVKAGD